MKLVLMLLAAAGLTGCVAYTPYGYGAPYYGSAPVVVEQPGYVYGTVVVPYSSYSYPYGYRAYPRAYGPGPAYGPRPGWGRRDQDRDGIPNRADRDRDGDGVPNREDRRPNNPRRH
jgi:hypothetical protein